MDRMRWGLVAVSIVAGLFVPTFYDWSGADQSRASPAVPWVALGILIADLLAIAWIIRLPHDPQTVSQHAGWSRFSIRQILIATTAAAVLVTAMQLWKIPLGRSISLAMMGYAGWLAVKESRLRWPICVLLISMLAPFVWVFSWREFGPNLIGVVLMLAEVPALVVGASISALFRLNFLADSGIGGACTAAELAVGLWMIHLGPKRGLCYTLAIFAIALYSSFILNALVRM